MSEQFHGEEEKNITEKLMLKLTIKLEKKRIVNGKVVMLRTLLKTLQRHTFNAIIGICSIAHCVESGPFFCVANGFGLVDFPKFSHVVG